MPKVEEYFKEYSELFQKVIDKANSENLEIARLYFEGGCVGEIERYTYLAYVSKKFSLEDQNNSKLTANLAETTKGESRLHKAILNDRCDIEIFDPQQKEKSQEIPSKTTLKNLLEKGHGRLNYDLQFW